MLGVIVLTIAHHDPDFWTEYVTRAMGSTAHLVVGDARPELVGWGVEEIERLEQAWSRFRPSSELSMLNASEGRPVAVSPILWAALDRCDRLWRATGGMFDPTVLTALERWGYDRSFDRLAERGTAAARAECAPAPGWACTTLDPDTRTVRLPPGIRVDLGGVGKGLAADLVAEGLVDRGARSACVALGGDIRVAGIAPEAGWAVPVEDPSAPFTHPVRSGALAMSTTLIRRWRSGGQDAHHLIDPLTGAPSRTGVVAAVVAADEAWWAEGLAKAAIVSGLDAGAALLRRCGVTGWITTDDGETSAIQRVTEARP